MPKLSGHRSGNLIKIAAVLAVIIAVVVLAGVMQKKPAGTAQTTNEETLISQVESEDGAPRSGRDPANQQQTSLADAASRQTGTGQYDDSPSASQADKRTGSAPSGDASQTGVGANGCYLDYGIPGEQCVPVHAATDGKLTCSGIHAHGFENGVKVSGTDRFNLDTNHDGTACGTGDN